MKKEPVLFGCVLMVACASGRLFSDFDFGYSLKVPNSFMENGTKGKTTASGKNSNYSLVNIADSVDIDIFHEVNADCLPNITGALETKPISSNGAWGEVTGFRSPADPETPEAYCMPQYLFMGTTRKQGIANNYAFCSIKDNKTVVICIDQTKDDPEMAKQIFESFRWTE